MNLGRHLGVNPLDPLQDRNRRKGRVVGGAAGKFGTVVDHSPLHSGISSLRVNAPIPATASRAIMFSAMTRPA